MATSGWRQRAPPPSTMGYYGMGAPSAVTRAKSRFGGHAPSSNMTRTSIAPRNICGTSMSRDLFAPGMIIRFHHFEAAYEDAMIDEKYLIQSRFGDVCCKVRPHIVVECHAEHYVCLPLFTHQSRGLANKLHKGEFVSIRDHRNIPAKAFEKLSSHEPLVTGEMEPSARHIDANSTVHIASCVARTYKLPIVKLGSLDSESTERLLEMRRNMGRSAEVRYASRA